MVYITSHISGEKKTIIIKKKYVSKQDIHQIIYEKEGTCQDVSLTCEGKIIGTNDSFEGNVNIVATLQLKGGKGGFGSMLRAIGAQIEKTTNREACRDLSGRRLRDINEEKRLKDFLAKKVEKEKERLEIKKKKLDQLKEGPKHIFEDKAYFEQREKREKDIYESLDKAFASGSSATKDESSKTTVPVVKSVNKNNKRRMLDDLDDSSDDSSDEDSEEKSSGEDNSDKQQMDDLSTNSKTNEENHEEETNEREIGNSDNTEHIKKKLKT